MAGRARAGLSAGGCQGSQAVSREGTQPSRVGGGENKHCHEGLSTHSLGGLRSWYSSEDTEPVCLSGLCPTLPASRSALPPLAGRPWAESLASLSASFHRDTVRISRPSEHKAQHTAWHLAGGWQARGCGSLAPTVCGSGQRSPRESEGVPGRQPRKMVHLLTG